MRLEKLVRRTQNYLKDIKDKVVSTRNSIAYKGVIRLSCFLAGLGLAGCEGFKTEPYIESGAIASSEKDHQAATSHKTMIGIGVNLTSGEKRLKKTLGAEYWTIAEPVDEDFEVPHDGMVLSGKLSYEFQQSDSTIYPFVGCKFENWRRNSSEDVKKFYGDLYFADSIFGLGVKHKNFYCELGGVFPVFTGTDSGQKPQGKLGITADIGIILNKKTKLEAFYDQNKFREDGSQTDFELKRYGLRLSREF